ncbi:flagellar hook-associated protein FlgK [Mesorhizobium sp. NBSH29]|uniref:flagellar hook-associated protein FlgK n=1 Tax=Mesorhizobium sp. NBSH29 TaxID=2654249 RepID=UPI0018966C2B|nr:flagellar hook-associated protein FlgK [Mesorhizobium sp. NBSH29]QPC85404.1 flagellar hook-associated protein FlgK [Mesorhizobium sp. NBSH29]
MSLTSALSIAQSALLNTSRQTSVVSRNIADASNPDYSRRIAVVSSSAPGARVVEIQRAVNDQLFRRNLAATSSWQGQSTLLAGLDTLKTSVNGVDSASSPATLIGKLQEALHLYSSTPSNRTLAENAIEAARQVVRGLNDGSEALQTFRTQADQQIAASVADLNQLLAQFHDANKEVVAGTRAGRDVSESLDKRDSLLKKISEHVPVSTVTRGDNDMVVMSKDGAMLYEAVPRTVTFQPLAGYSAGSTGNGVYVDGVRIAGGNGANTDAAGDIAGLIQLRDTVAPTMQRQLDEIARGLVTAFAESDPSGVQSPMAGLFTWPGAPAVPAAGALVNGLGGSITVNAAMDSSQAGNPELLRDGGANGAAYVWNTTGGASYSELLISFGGKLDTPMTFDPAAAIGSNATIGTYSTNSISWLEGLRKEASSAANTKSAMLMHTAEALSNETGVNIDYEMSLLLDLEHSYQASARLMKAVDDMLSALLAAVR